MESEKNAKGMKTRRGVPGMPNAYYGISLGSAISTFTFQIARVSPRRLAARLRHSRRGGFPTSGVLFFHLSDSQLRLPATSAPSAIGFLPVRVVGCCELLGEPQRARYWWAVRDWTLTHRASEWLARGANVGRDMGDVEVMRVICRRGSGRI